MKYILQFEDGRAELMTDDLGPVWSNDSDDDCDLDEFLTMDDVDDVIDYLQEAGVVDEGDEIDTVESEGVSEESEE